MLFDILRQFDQRFPREMEAEYIQAVEPAYFLPVVIVLVGVLSFHVYGYFTWHGPLDYSEHRTLKLLMLGQSIVLDATAVVSVSFIFLKQFTSLFRNYSTEWIAILWPSLFLLLACVCNMWYLPKMFGKHPREVFPGSDVDNSEFDMVLLIDAATTCMCFSPVRSHLVWIVPSIGFVSFFSLAMTLGSRVPEKLPFYFFVLGVMVGLALNGKRKNEKHDREKWLAQKLVHKQADHLVIQHECIVRMLTNFCDCLLDLGPTCLMRNPGPRFASMLLHNSERNLHGFDFCDYIASEEDRSLFIDCVSRSKNRNVASEMIHIRLKDATSRQFPVRIYITCYLDEGGGHAFLIGIAEPEERTCFEEPSRATSLSSNQLPPVTLGRTASGSSVGSADSSVASEKEWDDQLQEIGVDICDDDDFTIMGCTPGFTALSGPLHDKQGLLEWISKNDEKRFAGMMQRVGNEFCRTENDIVLQTPSGAKAGIEFVSSDCHVDAVTYLDGTADLKFRLVLSGIRERRCKRSKKAKQAGLQKRATQSSPTRL